MTQYIHTLKKVMAKVLVARYTCRESHIFSQASTEEEVYDEDVDDSFYIHENIFRNNSSPELS